MTADLSTPTKDGLWRRIARALGRFGDALDATETSLLETRVARLERQLAELTSRRDR